MTWEYVWLTYLLLWDDMSWTEVVTDVVKFQCRERLFLNGDIGLTNYKKQLIEKVWLNKLLDLRPYFEYLVSIILLFAM